MILRAYGSVFKIVGAMLELWPGGKKLSNTAPTSGQSLTYDAITDTWIPVTVDGSVVRTLTGTSGAAVSSDDNLAVPEVFTLTLPLVAASSGQRLIVTCSTGTRLKRLVVAPQAGERINDLATSELAYVEDVRTAVFISDGSRWLSDTAKAFDISRIPGLVADYSADAIDTAGRSITQIRDRVTGARGLLGGTTVSARPTVRDISFELNGKPGINFYATNSQRLDAQAAADFTFLNTGGGSTILGYVVPQGTAADQCILDTFGFAYVNGPGVTVLYDGGNQRFKYYLSRGGSSMASVTDGTVGSVPFGQGATFACRVIPNSTSTALRVNGSNQFNTSWNTPASAGGVWAAATYPMSMGALANGGANYFQGIIGRIALFDRDLSDAECVQAELALERAYRAVAATSTTAPIASQLGSTVTCMYIGDSITEGNTGASVGEKGGFRKYVAAQSLGFTLDAIGPNSYGDFADNQHHGQSGWVIKSNGGTNNTHFHGTQALTQSPGSIDKVLRTYAPQIAVINLGVNNLSASDALIFGSDHVRDLYEMILTIHARVAGIRFVLCTLTPADTGISTRHLRHKAMSIALGPMAAKLRAMGVLVSVADTFNALNANATDVADGLHPSTIGYNKMGAVIAPAIKYAAGYT